MEDVVRRYLRCFSPSWDEELGWENARFVILDTESTGLDAKRDRLVSIGAVSSMHFQLFLEDVFEVFLPIAHNTSAVHVHGITRELAAERGMPEAEAIAGFLDYLRDGVIVGHHVRHDVAMLEEATRRHFGLERLSNLVVDTMDLTLRLEELGRMTRSPFEEQPDFSLDGLCRRFAIPPHDRHTAMGDAFLTGQIFIKLLKRAKRADLLRLGQLTEPYSPPEEDD
jgi:DNA polymerase III subunit epsilon